MPDPDLLTQIDEAMDGVTPGPWRSAGGYLTVRDPDHGSFVFSIYDINEMGLPEGGRPFQAVPFARREDARFIAAARTLLPAAREEIARLREQVRIAREALAKLSTSEYCDYATVLAALSATEAKEPTNG